MNLLCPVCDRLINENESEYNKYLATLRKENVKSVYKKYTFTNITLDDVNKILSDCVSTHNQNIDFYLINCEFKKEFDKNFTANIELNYHSNTDYTNIKSYLFFYDDSCESGGHKISNTNHMIINTLSCMCNLTYKH